MSDINAPFTAVQIALRSRMWLLTLVGIVSALLMLIGLAAVILGCIALFRFGGKATPAYGDDDAHFMYGSIGAETHSGLPYWMWKALPSLFPAEFEGRSDYSAFGFQYEKDDDGRPLDLPIGISRREVSGIDVVWFNCGTCHVGTWRETPDASAHVVPGMPSNNLNLYRFIRFVLDLATDERLSPDNLIPAMEREGARFDWLDKLAWRYDVLPTVREGLIEHRSRLLPLLENQPAWGPGRVDTFNPYKLLLELPPGSRVPDAELVGTADFPAIFNQRPREGMKLHWDGDNNSLAERNLSAAVGAGVTPDSVDIASIERNAAWLLDLKPPPVPIAPTRPRFFAARRSTCRPAPPVTAGKARTAMSSKAQSSGKSSRTRPSAPTPTGSTPIRRNSAFGRSRRCSRARPTTSPISSRPTATPICRSTAYGCARPTFTTARSRTSPPCSCRRIAGPRRSCAAPM